MAEHNLLCSNLQFPRALTVILSHRTLGYLPHVIEASTGLERLRALAKVTQRGEGLAGTSLVLSLFLSFLLLFLLAFIPFLYFLLPFFSSSPWAVVPFGFFTSLPCVCESRPALRRQCSPACGRGEHTWIIRLSDSAFPC